VSEADQMHNLLLRPEEPSSTLRDGCTQIGDDGRHGLLLLRSLRLMPGFKRALLSAFAP
jgi:hypothetical protein